MSRFVFYLVDLNDATVQGTNDVELVETFINDDEKLIIHKDGGIYFCGSRDEIDIKELPNPNRAEDEDDDD